MSESRSHHQHALTESFFSPTRAPLTAPLRHPRPSPPRHRRLDQPVVQPTPPL